MVRGVGKLSFLAVVLMVGVFLLTGCGDDDDGGPTAPGPGQSPGGMVLIQPGTFTMGSPGDEPGRYSDETQHQVTLTKAFYLSDHEVTQAEWEAVMGWNDSGFSGDSRPVETVTWNQNANGYRLPTEAEWEYACRAGSTTSFCNGAITELYCGIDPNLTLVGWYCGNAGSQTRDVGQKTPNSWGLYELHGSSWDRVKPGGCWISDGPYCRLANRPDSTFRIRSGAASSSGLRSRDPRWNALQGAHATDGRLDPPSARADTPLRESWGAIQMSYRLSMGVLLSGVEV